MQLRELPEGTQRKLAGVEIMANWFGQFFVRQANRIVNEAMNDDNKADR